MSNELCKHCLTPIDFGIDNCGCDGDRIDELEEEVARLREFFKSEIAHMETWERNAMAARFKKALRDNSDD
jgi:hypothetical protein